MKNLLNSRIILCIILIFMIGSCKKDNGERVIKKSVIQGYVQKGPFINGTSVQMYELNSSLGQTGKSFNTQIIDNKGSFEIDNVTLSSQFVEFLSSGYYFNEISGELSPSQLSLYSLSDITNISSLNVNILTHLEKDRVEYLVNYGISFSVAKDSAQAEILGIFGFKNSSMNHSESLDISINKDEDAILLAISIILQGDRSVADLTELLANISADIKEDGILNNTSIIKSLKQSAENLRLNEIRANLVKRYSDLGVIATIPDFEKYVNSFLQSLAFVITKAPSDITINNATLNGLVNPNDLTTKVFFEYGTTLSYGDTVQATQSQVTGSVSILVNSQVSNLNPGTTYHYRVDAKNSAGITYGDDITFKTLGQLPTISVQSVINLQLNSATLTGSVNANNLSTTVTFEYGTTLNYGSVVTATQSPVTGSTNTVVGADISNLTAKATYHFRINATNALGTTYGNDFSFVTDTTNSGKLSDIEGNQYSIIGIGNQIWMAENLKTTRYNNGDTIPNVTGTGTWVGLTTGAYCWYNNDSNNKTVYGALYNWYAVNTDKLCPIGWHVPSDAEWKTLEVYLGMSQSDADAFNSWRGTTQGGDLKETGIVHWNAPNTGATNSTGFKALPAGQRNGNGIFYDLGTETHFHTTTENGGGDNYRRTLDYSMSTINRYSTWKLCGYSVRCIKD